MCGFFQRWGWFDFNGRDRIHLTCLVLAMATTTWAVAMFVLPNPLRPSDSFKVYVTMEVPPQLVYYVPMATEAEEFW